MSAQPVDVLAVLKRHLLLAQKVACDAQIEEAREVLAAVDELAATAENVLAYEHVHDRQLALLRAALRRVQGQ